MDSSLLLGITQGVALLVIGAVFNRVYERRPRVVVFYGHIGAFQLLGTQGRPPFGVHTHSVVMRNNGRLAAHNVRVPHNPTGGSIVNISVFPLVSFTRNPLPGGGDELLFPVLVSGQELTISYLYYPPLLANQINAPIRSDEGMAKHCT